MAQRISSSMRSRLERNREGRLAGAQWLAVVTQPLTALLVLLAPLVIVFGPRLLIFSLRGIGLIVLLVLFLLLIPAMFRARRYARAPLYFAQLTAGASPVAFLFFWRPLVMQDAQGDSLKFQRKLAPLPRLQSGQNYLVYYLQEADHRVLLSLVSADHPDAQRYQPTERFRRRAQQRS